jgi:hypothetical protein
MSLGFENLPSLTTVKYLVGYPLFISKSSNKSSSVVIFIGFTQNFIGIADEIF